MTRDDAPGAKPPVVYVASAGLINGRSVGSVVALSALSCVSFFLASPKGDAWFAVAVTPARTSTGLLRQQRSATCVCRGFRAQATRADSYAARLRYRRHGGEAEALDPQAAGYDSSRHSVVSSLLDTVRIHASYRTGTDSPPPRANRATRVICPDHPEQTKRQSITSDVWRWAVPRVLVSLPFREIRYQPRRRTRCHLSGRPSLSPQLG